MLALLSSFLPKKMEMGTEEPTPTNSAKAKFIIISGMASPSAANAVVPISLPANKVSKTEKRDEASMLMPPGSAAFQKSFAGFVFK